MSPVTCFHRPFCNPVYKEAISVSEDLTQRAYTLRLWKTFIIIIISRILFSVSFSLSQLCQSINIENTRADKQL